MRPLVFFAAITIVVVLITVGRCACSITAACGVRRPWDCGFGASNSRMQDTAEGFGQPIRHMFQPFFAMQRELPSPFDRAPRYRVVIGDRIWRGLYRAARRARAARCANSVAWLQQGRISTYLLYSFVTLVVLLALVL